MCSVRKGVLRNFAKFTRKHLWQSLFLIKLQAWGLQLYVKKGTLAQVFSCKFCEISKNAFFIGHLRATASNHPRAKAMERIPKSYIVIREVANLGKWKTCQDYASLTKITKENPDSFPKFLCLSFNNSIIKMEVPTFPNLLHIVPLFKKVWRAPEAVVQWCSVKKKCS